MKKRAYKFQTRTIEEVQHYFSHRGKRAVVVSAVGSGKTFIGASVVREREEPTLWVAHTRELVLQAAATLREVTGKEVGIAMPGHRANEGATIQVGTVQTLLERPGFHKHAKLVIPDEAHHYEADEWGLIKHHCPNARLLGLTATPERADGRPLGDTFDRMIVGAQYPELVRHGVLVPWTIYQPEKHMGHDLAEDPLAALAALGEGGKAFAYFLRIELAEYWAERWRKQGVAAQTISAQTPAAERLIHMKGMRGDADAPAVRLISNVYTMTEGVDVPEVSVVVLGRPFQFAGGMIQATGRASRAAQGKTHAILIDLVGSSRSHGSPHQEWEYSLEGRAIQRRGGDVEGPGGGGVEGYEPPKITRDGIHLAEQLSTYLPPESSVPERYRAKPHAERQEKNKRRWGRVGGSRLARSVEALTGGMAE